MASTTDKLIARKESGIGWIIFNNPDKRNAMSMAMQLATAIGSAGGVRVVPPDTNIVMIDLPERVNATELARRLVSRGVLVSVWTSSRIRTVTHLDVTREDCTRAAEILAKVIAAA